MGRRIMNRKDLRADYDAAERRKAEGAEAETEEEEEDDDEDDDDEEEAEGDGDAEAEADGDADDEEGGEDDDEEAPKKKKKKKAPPKPKVVKPKAKPRSRAAKVIRMRLVWGVFSNNNQCVATYEYPKRKEADAHAAKLTGDKKSTHFVQPVKEPIEEKEKEK